MVGRPKRSEEIATERKSRRPETLNGIFRGKLSLPPEFRDDKDHFYYWANDTEARIYELTVEDDFDVVSSPGHTEYRKPVDTLASGQPVMGILLRKPMDLHRKHQAEKETARKIQERGMTQNVMADGSAPAGDAGKTYVRPGTSISQGFTP